jgi:hypothetical protein
MHNNLIGFLGLGPGLLAKRRCLFPFRPVSGHGKTALFAKGTAICCVPLVSIAGLCCFRGSNPYHLHRAYHGKR